MSPNLVFLLLVPVIGFLLYRRLSSTFTKQPVRPGRLMFRMGLLSLVCAFLLSRGATLPSFGAAGGGAVVGVALAFLGYRRTQFVLEKDGVHFTPDRVIGVGIVALFLGRLGMRMFTVRVAPAPGASPFDAMAQSPLTLGIYFLLAGYYVTYYALLLNRTKALQAAPQLSNNARFS